MHSPELYNWPSLAGNSLSGARGHRSSTGGGFSTPPVASLFVAALAVTWIWVCLRSITAWSTVISCVHRRVEHEESPSAEGYIALPSTRRSFDPGTWLVVSALFRLLLPPMPCSSSPPSFSSSAPCFYYLLPPHAAGLGIHSVRSHASTPPLRCACASCRR